MVRVENKATDWNGYILFEKITTGICEGLLLGRMKPLGSLAIIDIERKVCQSDRSIPGQQRHKHPVLHWL